MAKLTKRCRVCGKEYEACKSVKTGNSTFNWREVACSPECGMEYLRLINASRSNAGNSEPEPERESVRSAHRSKSRKSVEADVTEVETPVFVPTEANPVTIETEYTEE